MNTSAKVTDERVLDVRFADASLIVDLVDGRTISAPLTWYPRLLHATAAQRSAWEKTGAGYGIHWPGIDEDLSTEALLRGVSTARSLTGLEKPWDRIISDVTQRERTVKIIADQLKSDHTFSSQEIGSTDLFVEKAQKILERRSLKMQILATISLFIVFLLFLLLLYYIIYRREEFSIDINAQYATQSLIAGVLKNASIFGLILGIEYLFVSTFRAFMHEATILDNRIHSLRLGRLYIYLKYSSVQNQETLEKVRDSINSSDIEKVFGWNIETSTAFKDIRPEFVTKTIWPNLADVLGKALSRKDG